MTAREFKSLVDNPTEENVRLLKEHLNRKRERKPLPIALAEANERIDRGDCFTLEELKEILEKLDRLGLRGPSEER